MCSPHKRPIDRVVSWPALPSTVSLCVNYFLVKMFSAFRVVYEKAYWPTFRVISAAQSKISTWSNVLPSIPSVGSSLPRKRF